MSRGDKASGDSMPVGTSEIPPELARQAVSLVCRLHDEQGWTGDDVAQVLDALGPDVMGQARDMAAKGAARRTASTTSEER